MNRAEIWHSQDADTVFTSLSSSEVGLSTEEVEKRLAEYGANRLPETKPRGPLLRFLIQFHSVLIYVLIGASIVTALLEHWVDAIVILGVVVINAVIGFVQEGKAESALAAIRQMLSPHAMVMRNGQQITVSADTLVPGDIVMVQSGDKVAADLRLFRSKGLQVQEAVLTGESVAIEKHVDSVTETAVLGDRRCMAYSGTLISHGQGAGVVVATGSDTELGRISTLVADVKAVTTPLLRQMEQFARWLTGAILVIALVTFLFGVLLRDYGMAEMFLAAVSLAVAAIPEGLPAIMTITLAIGVQGMARRNAIIRRLPAVETLGAVSVICSDKTGTLTRNEMTVRSIVTAQDNYTVNGTGYDPHGAIYRNESPVIAEQNQLLQILRAALCCNDAALSCEEGEWKVSGDPMEAALLVAATKAGMDVDMELKKLPRTDLIPFESEHRFMATLHHDHVNEAYIFLKGAPEQLLKMCAWQTGDGEEHQTLQKEHWLERIDDMAKQGQRVLAVAVKRVDCQQLELRFNDLEQDLVLLGMFGLIDPPRSEAVSSVQACKEAGIRVKMITGDHAATACAIARQLELHNVEQVLTGEQLAAMDDKTLRRHVADVDVYARVNPEHKLRLVNLLQEQGRIVAMTGDGVNDAPALKRADVGIAMGQYGTEAAKEAAEMVLADDNFASIAQAVEKGRTVYDNLKKAILFILPTNGGEALIILAAIVLGFQQLPLTPVQILWVNMVTAVTLALALAFEPPETKVMQRPPRRADEPMLSSYIIWRVSFVSIILMCGTFGLFVWEISHSVEIEYARTVAVNTLVMFEVFYLFNSRYITAPVLNWRGLTGNRYVLLAVGLLLFFQLSFTYLGPLQTLFGTTAIGFDVWLRIVLVASSVLFLVELEKFFVRHLISRKRQWPGC